MKMDIHLKDIIEIIKEKDQGDILIMMGIKVGIWDGDIFSEVLDSQEKKND